MQDYILLQKNHRKVRLEDYSTFVAKIKSSNRSRVVFQFFFTTTFLQQDRVMLYIFLIPSLFLCFSQAQPYLHLILTEIFLPLMYVLFWLLGSKLVKRYGSTSNSNFNNSMAD